MNNISLFMKKKEKKKVKRADFKLSPETYKNYNYGR